MLGTMLDTAVLGPLTQEEFARQWRHLLSRPDLVPGRRQERFLPVEAILCAAASLRVNHHRYGGSTSHLAERPVPQLATLFRRTNASILAKMANVDGSRPNGAKQDIVIATVVLAGTGTLQAVYLDILASARASGIGPDLLPDFLHLENAVDLVLLGQEEIEPDLGSAVEERLKAWRTSSSDVTARLAEVNMRVGQHRFAAAVLANYRRCCGFCGLSVPEGTGRGMLRASHIKPWSVSSDTERLDTGNGVAACPTHDTAFDSGLLTVNGGLRIHIAPVLAQLVAGNEPLQHAFGRPPLRESLLLPDAAEPPRPAYLAWHREHVWAAA